MPDDKWRVVDLEPDENLAEVADIPAETRVYLRGLDHYGTAVEETPGVWTAKLGKKLKSYWFSKNEAVDAVKNMMREHQSRSQYTMR